MAKDINRERTGHLLRAYRLLHKMTVMDLSDATGISDRCIYDYEAGKRAPSIYTLLQLSAVFDKTLEELLILDTIPDQPVPAREYVYRKRDHDNRRRDEHEYSQLTWEIDPRSGDIVLAE